MDKELNLILYRKLYLCRRSEEAILRYYSEDQMKTPMHMSMGQEAIPVGVVTALGERGQIFASYRSHAAFLAKTGDVERFFLELYGKTAGTAEGKAGSMHLSWPQAGHFCSSAIVASCIPLAAGAAFANRWRKNGQIPSVFFGDGATDEGVFWETLNAACLMRLPLFFVCEDNGYAVHTSTRQRQGYRTITEAVGGFDCHIFKEDTTDAEKIAGLVRQAMQRIDESPKPVFFHLKYYRYLEHVGVNEDFDAGYRPRQEYEAWKARDPVLLQRRKLLGGGVDQTLVLSLEKEIDSRIEKAVASAKEAPFPGPERLLHGVFYEKD